MKQQIKAYKMKPQIRSLGKPLSDSDCFDYRVDIIPGEFISALVGG